MSIAVGKWRVTVGEKVLIVDDEMPLRDLLGEFLEREGYEVLLASAPLTWWNWQSA